MYNLSANTGISYGTKNDVGPTTAAILQLQHCTSERSIYPSSTVLCRGNFFLHREIGTMKVVVAAAVVILSSLASASAFAPAPFGVQCT